MATQCEPVRLRSASILLSKINVWTVVGLLFLYLILNPSAPSGGRALKYHFRTFVSLARFVLWLLLCGDFHLFVYHPVRECLYRYVTREIRKLLLFDYSHNLFDTTQYIMHLQIFRVIVLIVLHRNCPAAAWEK